MIQSFARRGGGKEKSLKTEIRTEKKEDSIRHPKDLVKRNMIQNRKEKRADVLRQQAIPRSARESAYSKRKKKQRLEGYISWLRRRKKKKKNLVDSARGGRARTLLGMF